MKRLATGGLIDRSRTLTFTFNGERLTGHPGDTLASALLANGRCLVARSFKYHRPRGIVAAGVEEPNALVTIGTGASAIPNLKATEVPLTDGLVAASVNCWPGPRFDLRSVHQWAAPLLGAAFYYKTFIWPNWHVFEGPIRRAAGLGTAPEGSDPDRYIHQHLRCDVLVVGGGTAGLAAAAEAAASGQSVVLMEQDFALGGVAAGALGARVAALAALPNVRLFTRTTVFGYYDHGALAAVEQLSGDGPTQRLWKIRAGRVVLATGAIERPLGFAGNDRPGVMLASAMRVYLQRFGVLCGQRIVVATNNDSAAAVAIALRDAGAEVTLVDARPHAALIPDIDMRAGTIIAGATGGRRVAGVRLATRDGRNAGHIRCDAVAMSGGWSPTLHLFSQSGGQLRYDANRAMFVAGDAVQPVSVGGGAAGFDLSIDVTAYASPSGKAFVDFANDVLASDIGVAAQENYVSVEHLKRYTTLGMGVDQGKTSNVNGLMLLGERTARAPETVGTTRFRPPYTPVTLGAIAGPGVGAMYHPLRHLPAHDWHAAHGALFEEHGGWARPTVYPRQGEGWEQAVLREVRTVRASVGLFDSSSLGKIEVIGADAGTFLDRIYVGTASTLRIGSARYGLMLNEQGVIIDDGVFVRLADDHYLVHTTSGGADRIAAMMEEWRQCEWPSLDVAIVPVTLDWATWTLSGPAAALVLGHAGTVIDLVSFPHMTWRIGTVAGLPARVLRASFTGEASYEISVAADHATALGEALALAGTADGLIPYGIEALMTMRIEKGFIHVGVDTDGTTLPGDVGMAGGIARKSSDFIGRRSLARADAVRPDRLQLVGLASDALLPVGAHILAGDAVPGDSHGHVSSSAWSPSLDRPIALAMLRAGRSRLGETVTLYDMGRRFRAAVIAPGVYDPAGERLRG